MTPLKLVVDVFVVVFGCIVLAYLGSTIFAVYQSRKKTFHWGKPITLDKSQDGHRLLSDVVRDDPRMGRK